MSVEVVFEDERWRDAGLQALAERACAAVMVRLGLVAGEVVVLACDDARIAGLNAGFRGRGQATNVLSWPSQERGAAAGKHPAPPDMAALGDIAIAYDTCLREAVAAGREFADHTSHLLVHATLHLLGYDHIHDTDAALMEGLEAEILGNLGISDPYGGRDAQ